MSKRKESATPSKVQSTPSKRRRKEESHDVPERITFTDRVEHTPTKLNNKLNANHGRQPAEHDKSEPTSPNGTGGLTPKATRTALFTTPSGARKTQKETPSRSTKADRSAKRKSARTLLDTAEADDWDNSTALARAILADGDNVVQSAEQEDTDTIPTSAPVTPSKQGRGRPKGAKNKRSPTPEGDLPPEERYFFQNRLGPPKVSSNVFSSLGLLAQDEYLELMRDYRDEHEDEKAYLSRLHTRSYPQWKFELDQGFGVCLYGYGSKKKLVNKFAEWLYPKLGKQSKIVVLNGYTPRINLRNVLHTIGSALVGPSEEMKLAGQPYDMVDTILSHLSTHVKGRLYIIVNSIDGLALRKLMPQSILSRLAGHPKVALVATADTPNFPILWNSVLKDQFRFLYHDCTTFAPYAFEINPVDDVNDLLGRRNRRAGGKEGIGYVLKSLPENARNLYRVLLTEILGVVNDDLEGYADNEDNEEPAGRNMITNSTEEVGIEYRALYQKASEEFICSSDMNFRFLLKEFHDHQMLTSKRDASGTEVLGVPLSKDEMEAVLEDLVLA